jgi:hypothetical protein
MDTGEITKETVKTIVQGMPDRFGVPVVTTLVWFLSFPREAAGAMSTRHSLRPLLSEGHVEARLGRIARAESAGACLDVAIL